MQRIVLRKIINKLLYTISIVVLLTIANNTIYPGLSSDVYKFGEIDRSILDVCSITSQGIRPNVFAGIVINLITSISQYFNNLQKRSETKIIYEKLYILFIVLISISYSIIQHPGSLPFIDDDIRAYFFISYSMINVAISLFFTWLNRRLLINGLGNGITVILTIQILNKFINSTHINSLWSLLSILYHNFIYIFIMLSLCSVFEEMYIGVSVIALNPKSQYITESSKIGSLKYKPIKANVTAHVLTAQVKNISVFIHNFTQNSGNLYVYNTFMRYLYAAAIYFSNLNTVASQCFYFLSLFVFNYIYNTVYHHRLDRIIENMKNNICYISNVRINDIVTCMNIASLQCAFVAVVMTVILILLPKGINLINPNINISLSPIDLMIMASAFMHFKQFMARVCTYYEYQLSSAYLAYKK